MKMARKRKADSTVAKEIRALDELATEAAGYTHEYSVVMQRICAARGALRWQQSESPMFGLPSAMHRRWLDEIKRKSDLEGGE